MEYSEVELIIKKGLESMPAIINIVTAILNKKTVDVQQRRDVKQKNIELLKKFSNEISINLDLINQLDFEDKHFKHSKTTKEIILALNTEYIEKLYFNLKDYKKEIRKMNAQARKAANNKDTKYEFDFVNELKYLYEGIQKIQKIYSIDIENSKKVKPKARLKHIKAVLEIFNELISECITRIN